MRFACKLALLKQKRDAAGEQSEMMIMMGQGDPRVSAPSGIENREFSIASLSLVRACVCVCVCVDLFALPPPHPIKGGREVGKVRFTQDKP